VLTSKRAGEFLKRKTIKKGFSRPKKTTREQRGGERNDLRKGRPSERGNHKQSRGEKNPSVVNTQEKTAPVSETKSLKRQ